MKCQESAKNTKCEVFKLLLLSKQQAVCTTVNTAGLCYEHKPALLSFPAFLGPPQLIQRRNVIVYIVDDRRNGKPPPPPDANVTS